MVPKSDITCQGSANPVQIKTYPPDIDTCIYGAPVRDIEKLRYCMTLSNFQCTCGYSHHIHSLAQVSQHLPLSRLKI